MYSTDESRLLWSQKKTTNTPKWSPMFVCLCVFYFFFNLGHSIRENTSSLCSSLRLRGPCCKSNASMSSYLPSKSVLGKAIKKEHLCACPFFTWKLGNATVYEDPCTSHAVYISTTLSEVVTWYLIRWETTTWSLQNATMFKWPQFTQYTCIHFIAANRQLVSLDRYEAIRHWG